MTQACGAPPAGPFHGDSLADLAPGEMRQIDLGTKTIQTSGVSFNADFGAASGVNSCKTVGAGDSPGGAIYKMNAAPTGGYTLLGSPTVVAEFTSPGANNQIAARLMDIAPNGDQKLIARGLWRPETSEEPVKQVFQLYSNAWKFEEGHIAKLELLPHDEGYSNVAPGQTTITVEQLEWRLPVAESPGEVEGLVTAPAEKILPGATQLAPGFDSGPPVTRFVTTPKEISNNASPTFDYMSSDVGSTYECRLDSNQEADFNPCPRNNTLTGLDDGEHVFEVRAIDQDSMEDPTPISFEFTVDTVAPDTDAKVKNGPGKSVKVVMSSNEDGVKFQCKRNGDWKGCDSPKVINNPGAGSGTLQVRAKDRAKNVDPTPAKAKLKD